MPSAQPLPASASGVRYQIVGWATLMSLLLYLDRFCISICTNYIRQDLNVSQFLIEWLSFAFFITYGLFQVPSGWLTDKFGVRRMLTVFILGWSLCTGLQAFAQTFVLLAVLQLLCGVAQAGAYPAGARLVRDWNPPTSRGKGSAMIALGGRVGAGIAPILTAWMMIYFVPTTVDSHLNSRTDLKSGDLAALLSPPHAGIHAGRLDAVWQHLTDTERQLIVDLKAVKDAKPDASKEQVAQLRAALNRLIDNPQFYRPEIFADAIKEKEGRLLGQKLATHGSLPVDESTRLNRLALEATFPSVLGNVYVSGWRPSMLVYGVIGLVIAGLFWWQVQNTPAEDTRCNPAERQLILAASITSSPDATPPREQFPWRGLLCELSMWGNCLLQFTTNIGWIFLVRKMPQYLEEVHGVPLVLRGIMTSVPIWAGVVGVFCGGRLADYLVQRIGLKWGRRIPIIATRFTAAAGYAICIVLHFLVPKEHAPSWMPWIYVASLSLVSISTDLGVPSVWAFAQDVGGKYTASILGWGNMWGNIGAAVSTVFYGVILTKAREAGWMEWNVLFLVIGSVYLLGALGGLVMDPTRPLTLVREPEPA